MRTDAFEKVIQETPRFVPVFTIIKVPKWITDNNMDVKVGYRVYFNFRRDTIVIDEGSNSGWGVNIRPSYLKFIGYEEL